MGQQTQGARIDLVNSHPAGEITHLLLRWNGGDGGSLNELIPLVEQELRRIARLHMLRERPVHTLQATALVNEAYLKLVDQSRATWRNRAQFFNMASTIMRRILVDHARALQTGKRGSGAERLPLDEFILSPAKSAALVRLDNALEALAKIDPRKARIVELRYFGGLSVEETAEALDVHPNTVVRDWNLAKAWLAREMNTDAA